MADVVMKFKDKHALGNLAEERRMALFKPL